MLQELLPTEQTQGIQTPPPYLRLIAILLSLLTAFIAGVVLLNLRVVLIPFAFAALFSIILQPLTSFLRKRRIPVVFGMVIVILALSLFGFVFGLILSSTIRQFLTVLPLYEPKFNVLVSDGLARLKSIATMLGVPAEELEVPFNFSTFSTTARAGLNTVIGLVSNAFLILLFMLFMLMGAGQTEKKVRKAFPPELADRISSTVRNIGTQVRQYLVTKTLVSLATGTLIFAVLWIIGVDFPIIWGFLTFLLNFIPNVGSMFAIILPFLLSLLQFDSISLPLIALGCMALVQIGMGNVIEPRLMGFSLNLSPLLVLMSLIFWGWLWGIWGMVLAVPLTATIKIIMENIDTLRPFSVLMSGPQKE